MKLRWWQTAEEMSKAFIERRNPVSDDSFVASCQLPDTELAYETALTVRRSVAAYGMVAPEFIAGFDRYPDELGQLTGWDSLDFMGWILELERELDEPVPEEAYSKLRTPFSVYDLVHLIYNYRLGKRQTDRRL